MLFGAVLIGIGTSVSLDARPVPDNAGWINVTDHGAVGNGSHDDTQAIKNAIASGKKLYFPKGTYLITNQLVFATNSDNAKYIFLEGESESNTVIRLSDNNTAFQNTSTPRPMVSFYEGTASHENAFRNFARDLTFNVGKNNPGACGLRFTASNQGGLENITIKAEPNATNKRLGARGLDLSKPQTGPEFFKNITVDGFAYGVYVTEYGASTTWENITFKNQYTKVISNVYNAMFMRKVTSTSPVAFYDDNGGVARLVLLDSTITGPGSGSAIITGGHVLLRNVTASGWTTIVNRDSGTDITNPATVAGEYSSSGAVSAFSPAQSKTLNLPIADTPVPPTISGWVHVPNNAGDDTQAIKNAITLANQQLKTGLYFSTGTYDISSTIDITGGIRHVMGYEANVNLSSAMQTSGTPVFRFTGLTGPDITFERFSSNYNNVSNSFVWFEHNTNKNVVLRRLKLEKKASGSPGVAYRNTSAGTGKLFIEDVPSTGWRFSRQTVYARQINPETVTSNFTQIINDGGKLWILGMKIEGPNTIIETKNGGSTELMGGALAAVNLVASTTPAFKITNSSFSGVFINGGTPPELFTRIATETRGGVTQHYSASNPWFYTGYVPVQQTSP